MIVLIKQSPFIRRRDLKTAKENYNKDWVDTTKAYNGQQAIIEDMLGRPLLATLIDDRWYGYVGGFMYKTDVKRYKPVLSFTDE